MTGSRWCGPLLVVALVTGCAAPQGEASGEVDPPPPVPVPSQRSSVGPAPSPVPVVVPVGAGRLAVVPGGGEAVGSGPLRTYEVEVEVGLGVDVGEFARAVERTLADPRSWTAGGRRALQRVERDADVRIALASPRTVDRLCAPLQTNGRYSCANGDRAVLNTVRWLEGADAYAGRLADYRHYLVNHEVGHVLGFGHGDCPAVGEVAPVMLQQTIGLQGCLPGPWPYP